MLLFTVPRETFSPVASIFPLRIRVTPTPDAFVASGAVLKNGDSKTVIVDEITRNAQFPLKARAITVNGNASQGTIEALINVIYTWQ